jgi:hypothetical protein
MIDITDPKTDIEKLYLEYKRFCVRYNYATIFWAPSISDWLYFKLKIHIGKHTHNNNKRLQKTSEQLLRVWEMAGFCVKDTSPGNYYRFIK